MAAGHPALCGRVYALQDGWTFSTAADVSTVAHHNGFATLVGEQSGGGYDGNTGGVSERMTLPASGLLVGVPQWMYTTANVGHDLHGRGAVPDAHVRPTVDDVLTGRDAELVAVVALIESR
ncbi:MAG: C-terminal processing protease CtpA/Prc [Chlamydiales bacterium]